MGSALGDLVSANGTVPMKVDSADFSVSLGFLCFPFVLEEGLNEASEASATAEASSLESIAFVVSFLVFF